MPSSASFYSSISMGRKFCILNCDNSESDVLLNLFEEFSDFNCVGIGMDYNESINLVLRSQPNIIVIDIDKNNHCPSQSPLTLITELFQYLDYFPSLIAISSSTQMAYNVIKLGFCDYLLKPLSELDLRKCLLRLKRTLKEEIPEKICIKSNSDHRFIDLNNILFLKADNNTTDFFLLDQTKIAAFETLKYFENILPKQFLRVHNSYVVNTIFLVRINFGKSSLVLKENTKIPFSRSHRREIEMLKKSLYSISAT